VIVVMVGNVEQPRLDWNFDDVKAIAKLFQTNTNWGSHIKSYWNRGGRCTNRAAIMAFTYRVRDAILR
jgi:hypothetical protein